MAFKIKLRDFEFSKIFEWMIACDNWHKDF